MSNAVGVSIIVTNLAVVGLFAYSAWSIHKFSRRIEKKIDDAAAADVRAGFLSATSEVRGFRDL